MIRHYYQLFLTIALSLSWTSVFPANESGNPTYTAERPLVYEDAWDLWPYAFLSETGEPMGYNIDMMKLIFKELDIPYKFKLKPAKEALSDLKAGNSDLMCSIETSFHDEYAHYGKNVIQIFTHSVVHKKDAPRFVKSVSDLATQRVIVHRGGITQHLMTQKGWEKNVIPYDDIQEALQYVHNTEGNQIVANTLSMKWLIHKFQYDDLELTPLDVPHSD